VSWRKLNYLVPSPQCKTRDGVVTEWSDARSQPSQAEIDAVDEADVVQSETDAQDSSFDFPGVLVTILKALHNHEVRIRTIEGRESRTLREVARMLRNL
jgi:hypothetical protein